jgi:hypothetical protein
MRRDATARDWLVEHFWPRGRAMALWSPAKAGKSELALWCAVKLAQGKHPWTDAPIEPVSIAYFDFEMTEDDLADRLEDFEVDPMTLANLHYALFPPLHPLDTELGGIELLEAVQAVQARVVIIDTFTRAVSGEENDADTVRSFARHTGIRLKQLGISYLRTDHSGKDRSRGMRGTSGKRDDIDVAWGLSRFDNDTKVRLDCAGSSRVSWVGPMLELDRVVTPPDSYVSYRLPVRFVTHPWPAGTAAKAQDLDDANVPLTAGRPAATAILQAAGKTPGRKNVLDAALKFRRLPKSAL